MIDKKFDEINSHEVYSGKKSNRKITGRQWKAAFFYGIAALLLFEFLWFTTFRDRRQVGEETKVRVMIMGDSIPGECRDVTSVTSKLGKLLGEQVFNASLGGTAMSRMDDSGCFEYEKDGLSMQAFAQSIATKDFGVQQTIYSRESATDYFTVTIDMIETVDFDYLETLFIEHGINDYHAGVPIENPEEPYDVYTFKGALRSTVETLRKAYPNLRIILVTPTYSWYPSDRTSELTCEEYDLGGGVLEEYVTAEIEAAHEMDVEVVDLYHDLYSHERWSDWEIYTRDGVHPNETGRELIARTLYDYLKGQ